MFKLMQMVEMNNRQHKSLLWMIQNNQGKEEMGEVLLGGIQKLHDPWVAAFLPWEQSGLTRLSGAEHTSPPLQALS